ncbi:MAG TPA: serine/threonine-protein phosphatase [Gammaproteobacteria bacterium]|nr:serine/threonine-protein phosphatase [Gammaproteobacteria bacterium]
MDTVIDTVICGYATDVGRMRDHNEDNFCVNSELGLWLVADGMGGHDCGEVASAIAVENIPKLLQSGTSLVEAISQTHNEILDSAARGVGGAGMGTTVVAARMIDNDYEVAWVGDSRGYLWDGRLLQLTHDHSVVQEMIDVGMLSHEEAKFHQDRNIVTQALGAVALDSIKVGLVQGHLAEGQKLLLCSDGLTGEVDDQTIADILSAAESEQAAAEQLITEANQNGGSDNITVVLLSSGLSEHDTREPVVTQEITNIVAINPQTDPVHPTAKSRNIIISVVSIVLIALFVSYLFFVPTVDRSAAVSQQPDKGSLVQNHGKTVIKSEQGP